MSPEADQETLIRRVSFALDRAAADARARSTRSWPTRRRRPTSGWSTATSRSPHYGEEMARHWLDLARYADTHGLHLDNERQMWPYRDWVVKAFNDNQPFDRFTDRATRRRSAARTRRPTSWSRPASTAAT